MDTRHHTLTILHLLHDRSHPIPSIPFSLQQWFTHSWMGKHGWLMEKHWWWWWRRSPPNPCLGRVAERSFWPSEEGSRWRRSSLRVLWKVIIPLMFLGQRGYVVERGSRGGARGHDTPCSRGQVVWAPFVPLCLVFWLRESSGKIGTLPLILEFFLKVDFLHKNETPGQFFWK